MKRPILQIVWVTPQNARKVHGPNTTTQRAESAKATTHRSLYEGIATNPKRGNGLTVREDREDWGMVVGNHRHGGRGRFFHLPITHHR